MRRHQASQRPQGGPKPNRERVSSELAAVSAALLYSGLMAARPVAPKVDWDRKVRRPARREASSKKRLSLASASSIWPVKPGGIW